jgi:hypothetical protein
MMKLSRVGRRGVGFMGFVVGEGFLSGMFRRRAPGRSRSVWTETSSREPANGNATRGPPHRAWLLAARWVLASD